MECDLETRSSWQCGVSLSSHALGEAMLRAALWRCPRVEELTSPANSHVRTLASGAFSSVKYADEAPADSLSALAPEAEERHS